MARVSLQPITLANWKTCISLSVDESQRDFVPSNLYSIAEAQFYPEARPLAIYNDSGTMVGFVMYGRDVVSGQWKIFRMMIDAAHQRQGYGDAAMRLVIDVIVQQPDAGEILICYKNPNQAARQLYTRLGFIEQSIDADGKVTAVLKVDEC
jgi:diamine N-acetyltransferase